MSKIDVAIVGCGYVANDHLKAWRKIHEARVIAVSDLNKNLARKTAEDWKIPRYFSKLSDLLAQCEVNVVDICTPPQVHAALAVEAMNAGANVLIEKPMSMTIKDAKRIVNCKKETGVKAGVIHNWLFDEPVLKATSLIKEGKLGEIFNIKIEALNTRYDFMASNEKHWCHYLEGGRFSEMLAHPIYLIRHFLNGQPTVENIEVSKVGCYPWMKSDELCVIFRVKNKFGRVYTSFNSSRDAVYIDIYGSEGILRLDLINSTIVFLPKRKTSRFSKGLDVIRQTMQLMKCTIKNALKVSFRKWLSGHDVCIKLFAESLMKNGEPPVSVEDGLAVVRTLEQVCKKIAEQEKESNLLLNSQKS